MTSLSYHLIYQVFCYIVQNTAFPWPQKALSPYAKMGKNDLLPDTRWPFLRQYHHFFLRKGPEGNATQDPQPIPLYAGWLGIFGKRSNQ